MNFSPHTFKDSAIEFRQILFELEHLVQKCAVHKKKFEFSVSQFRRFLITYRQSPNINQEMKKNQLHAFKDACDQLSKLHQLLLLHQLEGWENSIIEDPSEYVADALCSISQELYNSTSELNKEASSSFVYNRIKWVPLHILDIKCIKVSFTKYLDSHSNDEDQEINIQKMKLRLNSINKFIDQFNDKNMMKMISPGVRVFSPIPIHFQSWRIQYSDLNLINKVGEGSSCYVYYGVYKKTGATVAVKQLKFNQLNGDKLKTFQREVGILAKTSHPSLLNFVGATDTFPFCIVTDWMPNGTLFDELHNKKQLDPTMRTIALFDIALGMQYLHSKHIVHRDLKSLNVLIDEKFHACIGDFGFSKDTTEDELITRNVGTPFWMAPEMSIKPSSKVASISNCYTPKVDVYSYGIILWETSSGLFPHTNESLQFKMANTKPVMPFTTPTGVKELFDACCSFEPEDRPSFDEIVRKFMTGKILLNGADEKRFMEYVKETVGNQKVGTIEYKVQSGFKTEKDVIELIEALLDEGLPDDLESDLVEKCWNAIINLVPIRIAKLLPGFHRSKSYKPSSSINEKGISVFELSDDSFGDDEGDDDFDDIENSAESTNKLTEDEQDKIILVCKVAPLFIQTSCKNSVASLLRHLPSGSIPENIIAKIAEMIPSGSEDFDDDIVVASCKNGAADVAAVYSISHQNLKLAFEVVAREGVAVELKTAVADKCIQCLNLQTRNINRSSSNNLIVKQSESQSTNDEDEIVDDEEFNEINEICLDDIKQTKVATFNDEIQIKLQKNLDSKLSYDNMDKQALTELACAAIRCIVGIGEVRRLSPATIVQYLACDIVELRNCFYTVLCSLAILDLVEEMPIELADIMINNITAKGDSILAENAFVALAKVAPKVAEDILKKFAENEKLKTEAKNRCEIVLRMMMVLMISKNAEFKSVIKNAIDKIDFKIESKETQNTLNILKEYSES